MFKPYYSQILTLIVLAWNQLQIQSKIYQLRATSKWEGNTEFSLCWITCIHIYHSFICNAVQNSMQKGTLFTAVFVFLFHIHEPNERTGRLIHIKIITVKVQHYSIEWTKGFNVVGRTLRYPTHIASCWWRLAEV